jgi:hypothetical protein
MTAHKSLAMGQEIQTTINICRRVIVNQLYQVDG